MPADVATISGIIGTTTGVAGMITGGWSLIETKKSKSQDLRIERGRLTNLIDISLGRIETFIPEADQSRTRRFAAQGLFRSSVMEKWKKELEEYSLNFQLLRTEAEEIGGSKIITENLESDLQRLHRIDEELKLIIDELNSAMEEDKSMVESMRKAKLGNI